MLLLRFDNLFRCGNSFEFGIFINPYMALFINHERSVLYTVMQKKLQNKSVHVIVSLLPQLITYNEKNFFEQLKQIIMTKMVAT